MARHGKLMARYGKLLSLASQISNQSTPISRRREMAKELEQQLSNHDVRKELAIETSHEKSDDYSIASKRRHLLGKLWSNALMQCILMTKEIVNGKKVKCKIDDIRLPYKIMQASLQPDDAFDSSDFDIPKLSKKAVRSAFKFCTDLLRDANISEANVLILVDMLDLLCSKKAFLGCFKYPGDFLTAISEIFYRLRTGDNVEPSPRTIFESASKAFGSFFSTCDQLGIEVHLFVSDSLEVVSDWCKMNLQSDTVDILSCGLQHFFNGIATMLVSHPDHSIGAMKRHGRYIFNYCKRAYSKAITDSDKEALNRYILAHLFVAQVAGKIQGLIDGDLGDLGSASLTEKQLTFLLEMVIKDVEKSFGSSNINLTGNRERRQRISYQATWSPIQPRQQLQLELVVRLIACTQRLYISREGWDALENPDEELKSLLKVPSPKKNGQWIDPPIPEEQQISGGKLAESCWVKMVLRKLIPKHHTKFSDPTAIDTVNDLSQTICFENPLRQVLESISEDDDAKVSPIPYLAIIGASAEIFPAGECWALSATKKWHCLIPEDKHGQDLMWCHGSSVSDLVSILSILSTLLEEHGQPEGNHIIQYWIMLILTKLTETTAVIIQNSMNIKSERPYFLPLTIQWRKIWKTLLRHDLRYISHTNFLGENSLGEVFVILLTEIIFRKCTEILEITPGAHTYRQPSFMYEEQKSIWRFLRKPKIFSNVESRAQFELVLSVSKLAGLSGAKGVDEGEIPERHELLSLVLRSFKEVLTKRIKPSSNRPARNNDLIRSIASCIIFMVNGNLPLMSNLSSTGSRFSMILRDDVLVTEETNERLGVENNISVYLKLLWGKKGIPRENPDLSCSKLHKVNFDIPRLVAKKLRDQLKNEGRILEKLTYDFISESNSKKLRSEALTFINDEILYNSEAEASIDSVSSKTVAVKLVLSLLMTEKSLNTDFLSHNPDMISFFANSISDLAIAHFEASKYFDIASDLEQISMTFTEIVSHHVSKNDLSQKMLPSVASCRSILKQYSRAFKNDEISLISDELALINRESSKNDFDFYSSDTALAPELSYGLRGVENIDETKRKEPRDDRYNEDRRKRRKTDSVVLAPPNLKCAKAIGSLLLAIEPSFSNCRLVCETLLGTDIEVDPDYLQGDMNLSSVIYCVHILGKCLVLLHNVATQKLLGAEESTELTPIVMLCHLVEMVRRCTERSSRLFMYGNYDCANVAIEMLKLGISLTGEEMKLIIDVLRSEVGMRDRPYLRVQRLLAAVYVFENGSDEFHHLFDKFFANSIVKAGFDDPDFLLRRCVSAAAGVASCKLDEQRILNYVDDNVAPIFSGSTAQNIIDMFTSWYTRRGLCTAEEQDVAKLEAVDSLEIMESDTLFVKALLAGSTSDEEVFNKLLQEILEIATIRPGLEFMCYRSLEKLASMKGYVDVQQLIDLETEGLLSVWLEKAKDFKVGNSGRVFPLSLTSPKAVCYLMMYGRYDYLLQSRFSPQPNDESDEFQKISTFNFVHRNRGFIIPFTLLKSHGMISECNNSKSIIEHLSDTFGFKIILDSTNPSKYIDNDDAFKTILRRHIIDVQTMCILLMQSDGSLQKEAGHNVSQILIQVLTEETIESKMKKSSSLLIQKIIQVVGQSRSLYKVMPISEMSYYQAIKHLTHTTTQSQKRSGDIFSQAGTSLTEVTIYAYEKLVESKLPNHQRHAWSRFTLLGDFLGDQFTNNSGEIQLDFFLHVLNEVILNTSLQKCTRSQALILVRKLLGGTVHLGKDRLDAEVVPAINKLVGVCFHVHEESQLDLLQDWRQILIKHNISLRRSCGFQLCTGALLELGIDDVGRSADFEKSIRSSVSVQLQHDCLVGTYNILHWIVENRESLQLNTGTFSNLSHLFEVKYSDLNLLGQLDKRYCAQMLKRDFRERKNEVKLKQHVLGLKVRTQRPDYFIENSEPVDCSRLSCSHTTIAERLLWAELSQMETILKRTKITEVDGSDFFKYLPNYFCHIGKTSHSQKVRLALSRCIALLEPSTLVNISTIENENALSHNNKTFFLDMKAKCIECLAELLKARNTEVATAAVMTLEAILSNNGVSYSKVASVTESLIKPFIGKKQRSRVNTTILFKEEKKSLLKNLATKDKEEFHRSNVWCWDKVFWTFSNSTTMSFEVWIRHLTSAIIVCCFNIEEQKAIGGEQVVNVESSFLWHCQRIAFLDHTFAVTIFPFLILELLRREEITCCKEEDPVELKKLIATSFESILCSWVHPKQPANLSTTKDLKLKSLSLIIDTLDMLRKYSQVGFLSSKHTPNKKARKDSRHASQPEPSIPWQGVPYGVILNIDGMIVAQACMKVQRFASALFFLEMYFNSRFGKSGGLFEELDNTGSCMDVVGQFNGVRDISGMIYQSQPESFDGNALKERTLEAMALTSRCYKELGEFQLMHATNMQLSSLSFMDEPTNTATNFDQLGDVSSLGTLQVLGSHSTSDPDDRLYSSLTDSMEALGLEGLINTYIEGVFVQNKGLKEMTDTQILREKWFETNLDTQNWSMMFGGSSKTRIRGSNLPNSSENLLNRGYYELVFESLKSLSDSDRSNSKLLLNQAQSRVIDSLSHIDGEQLTPERFMVVTDRLRALQDVDRLIEADMNLSPFSFDEMRMFDVSLTFREIILTAHASRHPRNTEVMDDLKDHLWKTCKFALSGGRPQKAESSLSKLRHLLSAPTEYDNIQVNKTNDILRVRLEEAKILECRGNFNGAIHKAKQLIRHSGHQNLNNIVESLHCDAQILCGSWMTKYKTEQAKVILESYLYPAAERAKLIFEEESTRNNAERAIRVFVELGHILANLHDDLLLRIQSKDWEETEARLQQQNQRCLDSREHRRNLRKTYGNLKKGKKKDEAEKQLREAETYFTRLEKEYERSSDERNGIRTLVPDYLVRALKSFLSALKIAGTSSTDQSSHIFRMISLWFSHQNDTANSDEINNVMKKGLDKLPSFRFVALTNQLFSRIESCEMGDQHSFQDVLQHLAFRMCNDHPYHCIAPLVALENGDVDSKILGVQRIIKKIDEDGSQYVKDLLHSYKILTSAYNDLAHASTKIYQASNRRQRKIKFSELFPSAAKKSLHKCLNGLQASPTIITCPPTIQPDKDYGGGKEDPIGSERIKEFEETFAITESGIHRPKIVMCIGTSGKKFRQLVKGEDDIRQDAIMSQVFTYVNNLMKRRTNNSVFVDGGNTLDAFVGSFRHQLKMITYNVLPLSPSSGVLEWVEGTLPIINFLDDSSDIGAHSRYYPGEWSNHRCRVYIEKCPVKSKREAFDDICARHSPSFRFFFLERFGSCMESWHIAKMNYTRSVAVSSMVGHILGIGDRHLGNILINQGSGEVVHIDFGFVFEQAKLLPVPECVPFRLTRNMIDGMGPCGTEGLFVNVAEKTILILRQNVQDVLAILSAVVADPMYKWNVNPSKVRKQQPDQEETNVDSQYVQIEPASGRKSQAMTKTINKIKEKLQGYEDSTSGEQQGVEGQVQLLINSARDPNNLCAMFSGWGPWM